MPTRRERSRSLVRIAAVILCLLVVLATGGAATGPSKASDKKQQAAPYGPYVADVSASSMAEFSKTLNGAQVPFLIAVLDDADAEEVQHVWRPFLSAMGEAMNAYALRAAATPASSTVGKELATGLGIQAPALLLFDGLMRPLPQRPHLYGKVPRGYSGDLSVPMVMRWVFQNLSPDLVHRIDSTEDLLPFFAAYPGFPEMPRVLYFSVNPYVSPHMRILSQLFQSDAVFGAVVAPLGSPERAAVAARYGIRTAEDLPALLVLRPSPDQTNVDEVVRLSEVTAESTVQDLAVRLSQELPESAIRSMEHYAAAGDPSKIRMAEKRKQYVLESLARERAELFGDDDMAAAGVDRATAAPVVITSQRDWRQHCALMRPGHHCLAVFADQAEQATALATLREAGERIYKSVPVGMQRAIHFVILDSARSAGIMEYFMLGQQGLPGAVLLTATSPKTYYNFVGSFTADNLLRFYLSKTQTRKPVGGMRYIPHMIPALEDPVQPANDSAKVSASREDEEDL